MRVRIISLLILATSFNAFAQNPSLKTDTVYYYSNQPRVVVFNSVSNTKQQKKTKEEYNHLKINLISPISGDMAIHYERKLKKNLSFEFGPGVTLRNYLLGIFSTDPFLNEIERTYKLGYSFNANLRYYPGGAMEEFYFAPDVRFRRYNSEANMANDLEKFQEFQELKDFKLIFGYVNYVDDNIILDYYGGFGIQQRTIQELNLRDINVNGNQVQEPYLKTSSNILPLISFGLKIGFLF